ncbi:MAG: hypothetical protein V7676_01860 [Parasphingorhabdus sp.]|uniref:hypothetical protein n=1 Tax=Parasphingorhabdus sp. TaxID=2709688 RepID=UPI003002D282
MLNKITLILGAFTAFAVTTLPVDAVERRDEQNGARQQMIAGQVKSLRSIENNILPRMAGSQYIGPEYDSSAQVYRLKFIRDGRVIFIDVDGRTGTVLRQHR